MAIRIKGITVTLVDKVVIGYDEFNEPLYKEKEIVVNNVLFSPISANETINKNDFKGYKELYTLAIPKNDTNKWEDRDIIINNVRYHSIGHTIRGIDDMIPLDWNKKITVERYGKE